VPWRLKELNKRKSKRGEIRGRQLEERIERILEFMHERGRIIGFTRYLPYSPKDLEGKDFKVFRRIGDVIREVSFNVTISHKSEMKHRLSHPDVPTIVVPPEMTRERIEYRIFKLFDEGS